MLLYRPVGLEELRLIYEADMRAFPPRVPEQPIFDDRYVSKFERRVVGGREHEELADAGLEPPYFQRQDVGRGHKELQPGFTRFGLAPSLVTPS